MPVTEEPEEFVTATVEGAERLEDALERAGAALSQMAERFRRLAELPFRDQMRWTPPAEGVEVPRWLA